jgi:hypothetical protein
MLFHFSIFFFLFFFLVYYASDDIVKLEGFISVVPGLEANTTVDLKEGEINKIKYIHT